MTNIKFRAWDNTKKEMIPCIHIFINGVGNVWENKRKGMEDSDELVIAKNLKIMQFTGLHDKGGKEIFEGDIITMPHLNNDGTGPVIWDEKMERWAYCKKNGDLYSFSLAYGVEVIGNIYENANLLEGETK